MIGRLGIGVVACGLLLVARSAHADCASEATELRAHLTGEAHRARRWNLAWGLVFGVSSAAQLGAALGGVGDRAFRDGLYVGAAKAGLGAAARLVLPLALDVPAPLADACADRAALVAALADARAKERGNFYLGHVGSLAVNLAGAVILFERDSLAVAAESFGLGYAVGLLSIYTAPRAAWHVAVTPSGVSVAVEW